MKPQEMRKPIRGRRLAAALAASTLVLGAGGLPPEAGPDAGAGEGPPARDGATFILPALEVAPGATFEVPILIESPQPLSMVTFSFEFEPSILQLVKVEVSAEVRALLEAVPDAASELLWEFDPAEGWSQVALVLDYNASAEASLPPGLHRVAVATFAVAPEVENGVSPLHFTRPQDARYGSRFRGARGPVYNSARGREHPFPPEERFNEGFDPDLQDGEVVVSLIGDVGIFRRGDANIDRVVDISDPVTILGFLFLGAEGPLPCEDAADANDDGRIDLSDSVAVLEFLFDGASGSVSLSHDAVEDETPDDLGCAAY